MKKPLRRLRALVFIACTALFVYVLLRSGPWSVLARIRLLGWGFLFLIVLSGVRHFLRSVAWSYCIPSECRRPDALTLFGPRLVGEALDDLTPAGPLLGEPAKVGVVSRFIAARTGASSVILENLVYVLAALLFMLSGLAMASLKLSVPGSLQRITAELVVCLVASLILGGWVINRRILLLGGALDYLQRLGLRWPFLDRYQHGLRSAERTVYDFFLTRRGMFLAVLGIEFATNFTGVAEVYLILKITATHTSLVAAYLAESAMRAVQFAFSFIPFGVGVQEGITAATLGALGYPAAEGVSLAIIRKIRTLFWTILGLLLAAKYAIARPAGQDYTIQQ